MAELSHEEAVRLGLEKPGEISDADARALGLEAEAPAPGTRTLVSKTPSGVQRVELKKTPVPDYENAPAPESHIENPLSFLDPHTKLGAFAHGVFQGGTLGFGDELFGLSEAGRKDDERRDALVSGTPLHLTPEEEARKNADEDTGGVDTASSASRLLRDYRSGRDVARQGNDVAEKEHPGLYLGGNVAGGLAVPLPGPGKAQGIAKLGKYALNGAALGGVSSAGASKQDAIDNPTEFLKDVGTGAAIGAPAGVAAGYAGDAFNEALKKAAQRQALKAIGLRAGISDKLGSMGYTVGEGLELGQNALDEGLIPFGGSKQSVQARAERLKNISGNTIGSTLTQADTAGVPFDYDELANATLEPYNKSDAVLRSAGGKSVDLAENLLEQGKITPGSFSGANRAKSSAWDAANFAQDAKGAPKLYRQSLGAASGNIADQVERSLGTDAADALREANRRYGVAADALKLSKEAGNREAAKATPVLMSTLGAIGGGLLGGPHGAGIGAIAVPLLASVASKRGPAAAAVLVDDLVKSGALPAASSRAGLLAPYLELLKERDK